MIEFVARSVNGAQRYQAAGIAATAITQSISSMAAARRGIRLRPAGSVQAAAISGAGRSAYAASAGHDTKSGMKSKIDYLWEQSPLIVDGVLRS